MEAETSESVFLSYLPDTIHQNPSRTIAWGDVHVSSQPNERSMQGRHSRNSLPLYGLSEPPSNPFRLRRAVEGLKACLSWESFGRVDDVGWGGLLKFERTLYASRASVIVVAGGSPAARLNLVLFDSRDQKSNFVPFRAGMLRLNTTIAVVSRSLYV